VASELRKLLVDFDLPLNILNRATMIGSLKGESLKGDILL
jgi:hypothetical protein